jgi:F0F1-type ATP synthase assembly protein I
VSAQTPEHRLADGSSGAADPSIASDKTAGGQASASSEDLTKAGAESESNSNVLLGFSENASKTFFGFVDRYLIDLERLSRFKAKQSSMETVNTAHVKEASAFLASSSSSQAKKVTRYCETFGGVMVGGGLSELFVLLSTSKPSGVVIGVTFGLIGVGALLIGIFLGRD